jgi:hypothetical protein
VINPRPQHRATDPNKTKTKKQTGLDVITVGEKRTKTKQAVIHEVGEQWIVENHQSWQGKCKQVLVETK